MQDRDTGGGGPRRVEVPGLSPVRAFFVVGALAAIPLALLATRSAEPATSPEPARSPSYELTDAEAIAEFERLNAQLMAAYRERNIALAEDVFTSDSPMLPRVRREIHTLVSSATLSRTRFESERTEVLENSPELLRIRHVEILRPRFETEEGEDATAAGRPHRQDVEWTLRIEQGRWLLHNAVIVDVDRLGRQS